MIINSALKYARSGVLVFPAPPGTKMSYKSARHNDGRRWGATRDEEEIKRDWMRWPRANVCIVTGRASNLFVVEIDTPDGHGVDGFASLAALEQIHGPLPSTRTAVSPSGSRHYYFSYPHDGRIIRNSTSKIGLGIDVRGEGGMVIAPPSLRNGEAYKWMVKTKIAAAPQWLLMLVADFPAMPRERGTEEVVVNNDFLRAAVEQIPTELDWHKRNSIGMAIFRAFSDPDIAFETWDNWLRRSGKYNRLATLKRWRGISRSPPSDIGAGTLLWLANHSNSDWVANYDEKLIAELNAANLNTTYEDCHDGR